MAKFIWALCSLLLFTPLASADLSREEYFGRAEDNSYKFLLSNEVWTFVRHSDMCEPRVQASIDHYWKDPKYRKERDVSVFGYLVNDSTDCWVWLDVAGVTGSAILFKLNDADEVIDSRLLSTCFPDVRPLPEGLIHLY